MLLADQKKEWLFSPQMTDIIVFNLEATNSVNQGDTYFNVDYKGLVLSSSEIYSINAK